MDARTLSAVLRAVGVNPPDLAVWAGALAPAMERYEITTDDRRAMFLANVLHETGGLRSFVEGFNYAPARLMALFGKSNRISLADANRLGRRPGERDISELRQAEIANLIYGGSWGRKNLGNHLPNDGWYFRGRGLIQLTGRSNHTRLARTIGTDVVKLQAMLDTPKGSAESACQFWHAAGCNDAADAGDLDEARRLVNGGFIGLDEVERWYHRLLAAVRTVVS